MIKYYQIPCYTMKCRLYPNKAQAKAIDDIIYASGVFYNCLQYDIMHNPELWDGKVNKTGMYVNCYPRFDVVRKADYIHKLIAEHPICECLPSSSITTKQGTIDDLKKSFGKNSIEFNKPRYYNKKYPRKSYTMQIKWSAVKEHENHNNAIINLTNVGKVKFRGWNQKIRFGDNKEFDFIAWRKKTTQVKFSCTISKDNCGDYWICFMLQNAWKPINECDILTDVGVDAGVTDMAILSDGTKYENPRFGYKYDEKKKMLDYKLSKAWGWSNIEFREAYKKDNYITCSNNYNRLKLQSAKLDRKIMRKRYLYQHEMTTDIIKKHGFIAIESLSVKDMIETKKNDETNKRAAIRRSNLSDAAMSQMLTMLKYKADWYNRNIQPIGQYEASTKVCSCCGYVLPNKLDTSVREWTCIKCGSHHDRDVNAAKVILIKAKQLIDVDDLPFVI